MIRWTPRRKLLLLVAANAEETAAALRTRHLLSDEELEGWRRAYDAHGLRGLSVTKKPRMKP